jgi:prevent-host-death family protein
MRTIELEEVQASFEKLVEEAAAGEEIIIAKAGKPMARLVPVAAKPVRRFGTLKHEITLGDDWSEMDREIEKLFYESKLFPDEPEKP